MRASFGFCVVLVVLFTVGLLLGTIGAGGFPREPELHRGQWGVVQLDEPSKNPTTIEFMDGSRERGVVPRAYTRIRRDGTYDAPAHLAEATRFRTAHLSGFDFGAVRERVGRETEGRVDFFGLARPYRVRLMPTELKRGGESPNGFELGVIVSRIGRRFGLDESEGQQWFKLGEPVRLTSGTYEVTGYTASGPTGRAVVSCWGAAGERSCPIDAIAVDSVEVRVTTSDGQPSDVDLWVLPIAATGEPPVGVLLRAGERIARIVDSKRRGSFTYRFTSPVGRCLIGASRDSDRVEVSRVITVGQTPSVELELPNASQSSALPLRVEDRRGVALPRPTVRFAASSGTLSLDGEANVTMGLDGLVWAHLPRVVLDLLEGALDGHVSVEVARDGYAMSKVVPTGSSELGSTPQVVQLRALSTLDVSVTGVPDGVSILAVLDDVDSREGSRQPVEDGRARFEYEREGNHRLSFYVEHPTATTSGHWIFGAPIDLDPGANDFAAVLPPLAWLRVEVHEPEAQSVVVLEAAPAVGGEEPLKHALESEESEIDFGPLRPGRYLLSRYRPEGRHQASRVVVVTASTTVDFEPRSPNAMLVLPDANGALFRAGFREGDVITRIDGGPIRGNRLRGLLIGLEEGATPVTVARGRDSLRLEVDFAKIAESASPGSELRPIRFEE